MAETSTPDNSDEYKVSHELETGETCPCASHPVGCALPLKDHRTESFGGYVAYYASDSYPHAVIPTEPERPAIRGGIPVALTRAELGEKARRELAARKANASISHEP